MADNSYHRSENFTAVVEGGSEDVLRAIQMKYPELNNGKIKLLEKVMKE